MSRKQTTLEERCRQLMAASKFSATTTVVRWLRSRLYNLQCRTDRAECRLGCTVPEAEPLAPCNTAGYLEWSRGLTHGQVRSYVAERALGVMPSGANVVLLCGNSWCVAAEHLVYSTEVRWKQELRAVVGRWKRERRLLLDVFQHFGVEAVYVVSRSHDGVLDLDPEYRRIDDVRLYREKRGGG